METNKIAQLKARVAAEHTAANVALKRAHNIEDELVQERLQLIKDKLQLFEWNLKFYPNAGFAKGQLRAEDFNLTTPHGLEHEVFKAAGFDSKNYFLRLAPEIHLYVRENNESEIYIGRVTMKQLQKFVTQYKLQINADAALKYLEQASLFIRQFETFHVPGLLLTNSITP